MCFRDVYGLLKAFFTGKQHKASRSDFVFQLPKTLVTGTRLPACGDRYVYIKYTPARALRPVCERSAQDSRRSWQGRSLLSCFFGGYFREHAMIS